MSTRSSARNLFPPLDNPELAIRRRSRVDPTLLNDFEMATYENGDPPVPDLQTMEELCQPTLNGRGGPIAPIAIQATNFGLKNDMIQQVQKSCQFHGLSGDDANKHLDRFLHVTQSIKVNRVTDDALRLYLFPHSLTHHVTAWFDRLPRNSINTFEQMAKMFLGKYFPPSMGTNLRNEITNFRQQCYDLIENMTAHHNDWDTSVQKSELSSSITSSSDLEIVALKAEMAEINKNLIKVLQINQQVKAIAHNCETCGNPHSYNDCPATVGQTQNVYAVGAYNQGGNSYQPQGNHNLLSYRSNNYLEPPGFNQNQNRSNPNQNYQNQNRNQGNNQGNTQGRNQFFQGASHGQNPPLAYQAPAYQASGYQAPMNTASSSGSRTLLSNTFTNLKEDLKGITTQSGNAYKGPTIPTTSSPHKVVECETEVTKDTVPPTNNESTKDVQPSVVQIETPVPNSKPVVAPVVEPVEAPVSAPNPNPKPSIPYPSRLHDQKLRDKANDQKEKFFQIFKYLDFNISFTDALILMPKFGSTIKSLLTNKEKLFELARTPLNKHCSAVLLKKLPERLGDPGKFLIPCDFLGMDECLALADLDASINLMPLSMWNKLSLPELSPTCMTLELADRSISRPVGVAEDVYVKVGTFHFPTDFVVVDFDADLRVPLILERSFLKTRPCEEYSQEVLGFSVSGNPIPSTKPIVSNSSHTLTPFGDSDFILEETDAFLAIDDEPISLEIDESYYDSKGDILLLEEFLNDDPSSPPLPLQELKVRIVLKCVKITKKPDNIYTRSEATKKSQIMKQVFSKSSHNEAQFVQNPSLGTILAQRSKPKPSKVKFQSPRTKCVNFSKLQEGLNLPSCQSSRNSINTFKQMAKMLLGKYFPPSMVTKLRNEITNFCQHPDESLFKEWECYKLSIDQCPNHNMLPVTQIDTFYNSLTLRHRDTINAAGGTFMKRRPEECYDLIENMTAHHNDWETSAQWSESSSSIISSSDTEIAALKAKMAKINKNLMRVLQVNQQVKAVTPNCETCGGPHSYTNCPTTVGRTQNAYAAGAYQGNTITNPKEDLKGITTRSGTTYQGPTIPTTSSSLPPVVEHE
nr:reverse transcriptase domain-containing protein [Tanacetum cinerariifolium]